MAIEGGGEGGGVDQPFPVTYLPEGRPVIEYAKTYFSVPPFDFHIDFRPIAFENWTEAIEGDTHIEILIDGSTAAKILSVFDGPFSMMTTLVASGKITRRRDNAQAGGGYVWRSFAYDTYYIMSITQEDNQNYRLICAGAKEYLSKRLAIPAGRNVVNGTVSYPDGSVSTKPIAASQKLTYTNKTQKGVIAGLLTETKILQDLPITWSTFNLDGDMQRTYLLKDMRSIKEAIDNMIDDQGGQDVTFDGDFGSFQMFVGYDLERGIPVVNLSTRSSEMFLPKVETAAADSVNNLWTVGNASDGNILLAHKVQAGTTGKVLLQTADTQRSDIQTASFLLSYTLGILIKSGSYVRTMALDTGLTPKMFLAYAGNMLFIQSPEYPDIDRTWWTIVERKIDMANHKISFDLEEWVLDNNGDGIPDREQSL